MPGKGCGAERKGVCLKVCDGSSAGSRSQNPDPYIAHELSDFLSEPRRITHCENCTDANPSPSAKPVRSDGRSGPKGKRTLHPGYLDFSVLFVLVRAVPPLEPAAHPPSGMTRAHVTPRKWSSIRSTAPLRRIGSEAAGAEIGG
jgi:hypothetical protein